MKFKQSFLCSILSLMLLIVLGCGNNNVDINKDVENNNKATEKINIIIFEPSDDANYLNPKKIEVTKTDDLIKTIIEKQIKEDGKNKFSIFPDGVELNNSYVENNIVYVDFNEKIKPNVQGITEEFLLVGMIVNSILESTNYEKVQILINGEEKTTLNGHVDISKPISKITVLIKK